MTNGCIFAIPITVRTKKLSKMNNIEIGANVKHCVYGTGKVVKIEKAKYQMRYSVNVLVCEEIAYVNWEQPAGFPLSSVFLTHTWVKIKDLTII